jgi:antitoxin PrlF
MGDQSKYYSEATLTSKGQITIPRDIRVELGVEAGDRLRFVRSKSGAITIEARKRRSIVDIAREHPLPLGDYDTDKAVAEAMVRRQKRAKVGRVA